MLDAVVEGAGGVLVVTGVVADADRELGAFDPQAASDSISATPHSIVNRRLRGRW